MTVDCGPDRPRGRFERFCHRGATLEKLPQQRTLNRSTNGWAGKIRGGFDVLVLTRP